MKICLVRPPSVINPFAYIGSLTPPLGLAYLASSLREAGHDVIILDAIGENPNQSIPIRNNLVLRGLTFAEIVERIPASADIIGISGMFSSEWVQIRGLVNQLGTAFPEKLLVGGGEHFTAASEVSMEQCARLDVCVIGEGEETIVDLANTLDKGGSLETVKGLVVREDGECFRTGARARIKMVDSIPLPAWDLVPLENYLDHRLSYGVNRGRSMPVIASRGCPYQCTFCSNPSMWTTRWLARDPSKVVEEIESYIRKYDIGNVDFYDPTAIVRRDWIIAFCEELVQRDLRISWQLPSGTRCEAIDSKVAKLLYDAGCRNLSYAPESGSAETLRRIKKKVKLPQLFESLRASVAAGLNVKTNIIIGLPDETHKDILKTLWCLVKLSWLGAHDVSIGVFAPYPGSELYRRLIREKRISHSDEYFSKLAYVDITETVSYTDHVSSRWLRFYNWLGFALFYGSNYLFRPQRLFQTMRNLLLRQHESRGEMALSALLSRLKRHVFRQDLRACRARTER